MKPKFVFDERILLHLALQQLRTTREQFERRQYQRLGLKQAQQLQRIKIPSTKKNPYTDTPMYSESIMWATPSHNIMTTQYGRIKVIEQRRQQYTKPTVTVKRRIKIDRSQGN